MCKSNHVLSQVHVHTYNSKAHCNILASPPLLDNDLQPNCTTPQNQTLILVSHSGGDLGMAMPAWCYCTQHIHNHMHFNILVVVDIALSRLVISCLPCMENTPRSSVLRLLAAWEYADNKIESVPALCRQIYHTSHIKKQTRVPLLSVAFHRNHERNTKRNSLQDLLSEKSVCKLFSYSELLKIRSRVLHYIISAALIIK